jgi:hypothetical protein
MAGSYPFREASGSKSATSEDFSQLSSKFDSLLNYLQGGDIGGVSGSPIQIGRKSIKDIQKAEKAGRKELPDYFQSLLEDVQYGSLSPSQAASAYESRARGLGEVEGVSKATSQLKRASIGAPSPEQYARYTPFFQTSAQQTLGRTLSDPELQNYVSTFRGLGVKDPAAVTAMFGKMLTTSDEYLDRQYRFKPEMPKLQQDSQAFAQLLNTSFG